MYLCKSTYLKNPLFVRLNNSNFFDTLIVSLSLSSDSQAESVDKIKNGTVFSTVIFERSNCNFTRKSEPKTAGNCHARF